MTCRRTILMAALLTLLMAAGCIAEFVHPLSKARKAKVDDAIVGVWEADDDEDETVVEVTRKDAHWVRIKQTNEPTMEAFTTVLGERNYLNLLQESGRYIFAEYRVTSDGKLQVWLLDDDLFEQAIAEGKLKGKVTDGDVLVTDKGKKVRAVLLEAGNDARASEKPGVLRKRKKS